MESAQTPDAGRRADKEGPARTPHLRPAEEVLAALDVALEEGLSAAEARARRARFGPNRLRVHRRRGAWRILADQFKSLVVLLLLAAAAIAAAFGRLLEAAAIAAALVINAGIGFATEIRAVRSMEALRRMGRMQTRVRRAGKIDTLDDEDLVPGDVVLLEEGDVVPADLRLVRVENLQVNEAPLTGESVPVDKETEPMDRDRAAAERPNMAFRGTAVTRGTCEAVVVGTGMNTEIGRISELVEAAEETATPLERRLEKLGYRLIWLVLGIAVVMAASGIAAGKDVYTMVITAIVLAIAAVPEGLPIVTTVALGRGMWRMARRNAVVKRLSAVETLGSVNVIFSDKTGTLTENRMVARRIALAGGDVEIEEEGARPAAGGEGGAGAGADGNGPLHAVLRAAVLCNNAELDSDDDSPEAGSGDPTERALLRAGRAAGLERPELLERYPEEREVSFDTRTKMMATVHRADGGFLVAVKGAPEAVLAACTRERTEDGARPLDDAARERWLERNREMASAGLRVLAVAEREAADAGAAPYEDLTLLGLVGLYDPPRKAVKAAIESCRRAGIRVAMVTGDHAATAANIARRLGIADDHRPRVVEGEELSGRTGELTEVSVFARVSPKQKLELVDAYQRDGAVVAMTGDGVNDAPALKAADIGIGMGRRGTEVAQEASDIVLKDDAFETIVMAVEQGRNIFANIRKFVIFLLSGNLGQIIAVSSAALVNAPLPLLPLQILFINLLFDVFPALALGAGKGTRAVMDAPPRDPEEPILTHEHWTAIVGFGALIAICVLSVFAYALVVLELPAGAAVTASFLAFGFARLWHVFNMRAVDSGLVVNEVTANPFVWTAIALCGALLLAAVYWPPLAALLSVEPVSGETWIAILAGGAAPFVIGQAALLALRTWRRTRAN